MTRSTRERRIRRARRCCCGEADVVFHLAGVNRPQDRRSSCRGNAGSDRSAVRAAGSGRRDRTQVPIVLHSSTQAERDNPYGRSKLAAEEAVFARPKRTRHSGARASACPTCSASGARPNYNSGGGHLLPQHRARACRSQVDDPAAQLRLVYIDDVVARFLRVAGRAPRAVRHRGTRGHGTRRPSASWRRRSRAFATVPRHASSPSGWARASCARLYATYVSYLPQRSFAYHDAAARRSARRVRRDAEDAGQRPVLCTSRRIRASRAAATTTTPRPRSSWSSRARRVSSFRHIADQALPKW